MADKIKGKEKPSPMKIMRFPRSVDIAITNRCNLRCKYCSHFTSSGDVDQDLPKEEWFRFFKELRNNGVMNITLEGGEPFFREDLKEIITSIVDNRMRFSILTNGTLITEKMASFLASTGRCDVIQVSVDGSNPKTHDSFRSKGSFDRAIDGIKILREYGLSVTVRVTIHRQNVRDLDNVARMLLEDIGLPGFSTNAASFMGLCRQFAQSVMLTPEDRTEAMETLLALNKKYGGRISANAGPLAEAKQWIEMENAKQEGQKPFPGGGYLTSCGGPMQKIGVRADGILVPCIQISHIELGRINQDKLSDVWLNHPALHKFRNRCHVPLKDFEFCQDCPYLDYCRGNCPALAYTLAGDENHPSPDACLRKFLQDGGCLPSFEKPKGGKKSKK
jgi:SynChlorMet cassette radical SAM/SPASM protein ScmE